MKVLAASTSSLNLPWHEATATAPAANVFRRLAAGPLLDGEAFGEGEGATCFELCVPLSATSGDAEAAPWFELRAPASPSRDPDEAPWFELRAPGSPSDASSLRFRGAAAGELLAGEATATAAGTQASLEDAAVEGALAGDGTSISMISGMSGEGMSNR